MFFIKEIIGYISERRSKINYVRILNESMRMFFVSEMKFQFSFTEAFNRNK